MSESRPEDAPDLVTLGLPAGGFALAEDCVLGALEDTFWRALLAFDRIHIVFGTLLARFKDSKGCVR